jgi:hypothetical protein
MRRRAAATAGPSQRDGSTPGIETRRAKTPEGLGAERVRARPPPGGAQGHFAPYLAGPDVRIR